MINDVSIIGVAAMTPKGKVANPAGKLPWKGDFEDMRHFKNLTIGGAVLMGAATFRQTGVLHGRKNIVITSISKGEQTEDVHYVNSLPEILYNWTKFFGKERLFVIGGPETWKWVHLYTGFDEFFTTKINERNCDPDCPTFKRFPHDVLLGMDRRSFRSLRTGNEYYHYSRGTGR